MHRWVRHGIIWSFLILGMMLSWQSGCGPARRACNDQQRLSPRHLLALLSPRILRQSCLRTRLHASLLYRPQRHPQYRALPSWEQNLFGPTDNGLRVSVKSRLLENFATSEITTATALPTMFPISKIASAKPKGNNERATQPTRNSSVSANATTARSIATMSFVGARAWDRACPSLSSAMPVTTTATAKLTTALTASATTATPKPATSGQV